MILVLIQAIIDTSYCTINCHIPQNTIIRQVKRDLMDQLENNQYKNKKD
jgi:hypothetical protein